MCAAERDGSDGVIGGDAMVPNVGRAKRAREEEEEEQEGSPPGSERGTLARARVLQQPFEHLWKEEEETASNVVIVDTARGGGVDGCEVVFDVMGSTGVVLQRFASTLSGLSTALKCDLEVQQGPMGVFRAVNVTCHKQEPSKVLFELTAERYNRLGRERDFHFGIMFKSKQYVIHLETQSVHVLTRQKNCPKSLRRTRCPEYYDFIESIRGNFLLGKHIMLQRPSLTQNIKKGISQAKRAQRPASEEHQPLRLQQDLETPATKSGSLLRPGLMSSPDTANLPQRHLGTGAPDTRLLPPLHPYIPIPPLRPTRDELLATESSAHLFDEISTLFHHADEEPLTQQQVTSLTETHQSGADQPSRAAEYDSLKRSRSEEAASPSKQ